MIGTVKAEGGCVVWTMDAEEAREVSSNLFGSDGPEELLDFAADTADAQRSLLVADRAVEALWKNRPVDDQCPACGRALTLDGGSVIHHEAPACPVGVWLHRRNREDGASPSRFVMPLTATT